MSIITLLTDFGTQDEYVGLMKGVILSVNPYASIIDLTHHIAPQDLVQAAYIIKSSYIYFPKSTVHAVVIDPGVGSDRAIIAVNMMGQTFIAPDNGVLSLVMEEGLVDNIIKVDNSDYFLDSISRTFHGRDIFAPVAAHISKGVEINDLGIKTDKDSIVLIDIKKPQISDNGNLVGAVVSVDRFGNLITNIDSGFLKIYCKDRVFENLEIRIGKGRIQGISKSYSRAVTQTPLAIIGSKGYLEISLNMGSAQVYYDAQKGDSVHILKT